jgi:hypothetical protein
MTATSDGGYALLGFTWIGAGGYDMCLIKTDSLGNFQWQHTYGISYDDVGYCVRQTTDGGFILGGSCIVQGWDDMYLVKTDNQGNLQWQHNYGGSFVDVCYSVWQTQDGGYILGGNYGHASDTTSQAWLVKVDSQGNQQWEHKFAGAETDKFYSIMQTQDGGCIAGGVTEAFGNSAQMYLVKTDSLGSLQWQNNYGGEFGENCRTVLATPDGGYLLTGNWFNIYKVDSSGNQQWWTDPTWVGGAFAYSMCSSNDGGFVLAGEGNFGEFVLVIHMSGLQQAWVHLTPSNPPITIPAQGGSFQFTVSLTNCGTVLCNPQVWIMVGLPSGQTYGPVLGPYTIPLDTSAVLSRVRSQNVPASAPPGVYTYKAYVGTYNTTKWDSSSFTFTKEGSGVLGLGSGKWSNTGEPFPGEHPPPLIKGGRGDLSVNPNPFNPSTTLSFELPAASHISLKIYDNAGRLVSTLADGFREVGSHSVTFDGSELPSGVYLYRLQTGQNTSSGKLLLLK